MIHVLFDTNLLIDIALQREPFFEKSQQAIGLIGQKVIGYINALTLVNFHYLVRKENGIELTKELISDLLDTFEVANLDKSICKKALTSDFKDFEDAVQNFSAVHAGIEIIVIRNPKDYTNSSLKVLEPTQLIELMNR